MTTPEEKRQRLLISKLRLMLRDIERLCEQFPSGIDFDADPENQSPADATAHTAGLIWKACQEAKVRP